MLIKCPECGADVSNRACACVKCGCPLGGDADEGSGTVIVYGALANEPHRRLPQDIR